MLLPASRVGEVSGFLDLLRCEMSAYKITSGSTSGIADARDFIESLDIPPDCLPSGWHPFFSSQRELIVTRAPGRLDLMGGIADYSGSLVLQLPIINAVHVALQQDETQSLRIASLPGPSDEAPRLYGIEMEELLDSRSPIDYAVARAHFAGDPENHWAAYVAGVFLVLMIEKGFVFDKGARILIRSTVPEGRGVSSSGALEVAVMQAVVSAYEIEISPRELAFLCQKVENLVAGAPCGVMDQMTAACGEAGSLLELLCQPGELKGTLALPQELQVWGLDSGIRHSVGGSDYGTIRTAAFMGYRIIAGVAGLRVHIGDHEGHVRIDDPKWKGYLANVQPEEFERDFAAQIPDPLTGEDFLNRYDGITDRITSVAAGVSYPVLAATRHPIYEHARVKSFAAILKDWRDIEQAPMLGELMFQSHESYSRCGLGSGETDELVALVRESAGGGLYGAKITGGGSGGTVAVLGRRGADAEVRAVAERYYERIGYRPIIFAGSSPGAGSFGHLRLTKA